MKTFVFFIIILISNNISCQICFYQDLFNGNVTVIGVASWDTTFITLNNHNSSIVKKAFLVSGNQNDDILPFANYNKPISINGQVFSLNNSTQKTSRFQSTYLQNSGSVHVIDVTQAITQNNIIIHSPFMSFPVGENQNQRFYGMSLIVLYEDTNKPLINFSIWLNDIDITSTIIHDYTNLMPIDSSKDVAFSMSMGHMMNNVFDGSYVYINNDSLGLISGPYESGINNSTSGTILGQFSYSNDTIFAIGDDTSNYKMHNSDVLANLKDNIQNLDMNLNLKLNYQDPSFVLGTQSNVIWATFLTYTTPCDTFSTTLTDNINVCKGAQAQLKATGGIAYEWLPQVGLSCYNCPNPIVTADTINYYTCRIWNTDSCSKVLPVKINILPLPSMPTIVIDPTLCSGNTGHIEITNQPTPYTYTLDGGTPQTTLHFNNLSAGNHLLNIQSTNGCSIDTVLTVAEVNNVVAQFSASPQSGDVPLTVTLTNQSQNATNYIWYMGNDTLYTSSPAPFTHVIDTALTLPLTLISYNTFPQCSDTATVTIVAEYPFTIIAPSLYVSDENYTPYQIYTSGIKELHYELFTDQGKLVYTKVLMPTNGNLSLWNSNQLAKGIYLYRIWAVDDEEVEKVITGKVVVI